MLESISPYALLCQSKPKRAATFQLPCDARAQEASCISAPLEPPSQPPQSAPAAAPALPRTHYISGIQSRHCAACKHAAWRSLSP